MRAQSVIDHRPGVHGVIRPWLQAGYTAFAGAVLGLYAAAPDPGLAWFHDIALVVSVIALWYRVRLLAGMMALAVLLPELAWNVGFFTRLAGGVDPFGLARPVFEPDASAALRVASLSHLVLPALLLWLVARCGYDPRALPAQTLLGWAVLVLSVAVGPALAAPSGWTFGMGGQLAQAWLPVWLWVALLMIAYPVLVYLPAHLLLHALFGPRPRRLRSRARAGRRGARRFPVPAIPATDRREVPPPGRGRHARLRDLPAFALVRRRR